MNQVAPDSDEQKHRDAISEILKDMKPDRTHLIEIEARRVMLMADKTPETMLRRLGESPRFNAIEGLNRDEPGQSTGPDTVDMAARLARAEAALDAEREKVDLLQRNLDDLRRMLPPPDATPRRWWPW